ncbi:hypothetical protein QOT17_004340 [Balamuthia mandrillaris]
MPTFSPFEKMPSSSGKLPAAALAQRASPSTSGINFGKLANRAKQRGSWAAALWSLRPLTGTWVATEKVHGANVCFVVEWDDVDVSATGKASSSSTPRVTLARRREVLHPSERFFGGWQRVVDRYRDRIVALANQVRSEEKQAAAAAVASGSGSAPADAARQKSNGKARRGGDQPATGSADRDERLLSLPVIAVLVYGEMFGGTMSGVPPLEGVDAVQTEIEYSPHFDFFAFDVAVARDSSTAAQASDPTSASPPPLATLKEYLPYLRAVALWERHGFPLWARPIACGALNDMTAIDVNVLTSTVPALARRAAEEELRSLALSSASAASRGKKAQAQAAEPPRRKGANNTTTRSTSSKSAAIELPPLPPPPIAEGIVVRALDDQALCSDHALAPTTHGRAMFKRKSQAFLESVSAEGAVNARAGRLRREQEKGWRKYAEWNEDEEETETETELHIETITVARLQAVISKTGKIPASRQAELVDALVADAMEEEEEQEQVTGLQVDELRRRAAVLVEREKARWCAD